MIYIEKLTKQYEGNTVLDHLDLTIERGEIHALVGENGAGKSTLIKLLSGLIRPEDGCFTLNGHTYRGITPKKAIEEGIAVIQQEQNLLQELSVSENIFLGDYQGNGFLTDRRKMDRKASEALQALGVDLDPTALVKRLGPAQVQMVAIAKALRQQAKILILDEPTAPLTAKEAEVLFENIFRLKDQGVTILYVSHRMEEIFRLADRITVLRDGKLVKTVRKEDISSEELIRLMVGRALENTFPVRETPAGKVVLEADGVCGNRLQDVCFRLHEGEILGIAGLSGSGRTELARILFGASPLTGGTLKVNGKAVRITSPKKAVALGLGYVPENRKAQGVLMERSVSENITLPFLPRISKGMILEHREENQVVGEYTKLLNIKARSQQQPIRQLSGGNQQKVVLSKWLAADSRILLLDEPTQGVDVGAKYEIYQAMDRLSRRGIAILFISSEMEELIGMSDRILTLKEGQVTGVLEEKNDFEQEQIMEMISFGGNGLCLQN